MKKLYKLTSLLLVAALALALLSGCSAPEAATPVENEPVKTANTPIAPEESIEPNEPVESDEPVEPEPVEPGESQSEAPDDTWTVLIYMCGTDLESDDGSATDNLIELLSVDSTDDVRFIIQTGGTFEWQNDIVDPEKIQRWEVDSDGMVLVDEQELTSMGEAQTLADFLVWGTENYPAGKTMVSFWNHGGGSVSGVAFDEVFEGDGLNLNEIAEGLAAPNIHYELIGFDTCLMATLEMAQLVAPMANYMVASEEIEPGGGWDYMAWPSYLYENPQATGDELGVVICDSFYAKCETTQDEPMATLSVLDLSMIPTLTECFDAMVDEMTGVTENMESFRQFVQGVKRSENYGGNNDDEGYTNMVDLGDLTMNTENVLPATADNVLTALFDTVVYSVKGNSRSEANGISVFYPLNTEAKLLNDYAVTAAPAANYVRFIESITDWTAPEGIEAPIVEKAVKKENYTVEYDTSIDDYGMFTLEIYDGLESVASVLFDIYLIDYENNEDILLGSDNDIICDWDNGVFTDNFRGVWPTLNGQYCSLTLLSEGENYYLYSIPILLNGVKTTLRAAYIFDDTGDGEFVVYGAWKGIDSNTGMSARDIIKLKDGDKVTMLFESINWDTDETTQHEMGSFTVDGKVVMEESPLFDGDYAYSYTIQDVFGETYYTNTVIMEYINGETTVYETEDQN